MKRRAFMAAGVSLGALLAGCSRPDGADDDDPAASDPDNAGYTEDNYSQDGEEPIDEYTSDGSSE